jgi:transposase
MMEAMILLLGQQMSVSAVARHLAESDKRLWRVLEHYVMEAHAAKDWSQVRRLMIDETSARKGHRYVTVVLDAESHDLLLMVEGRSAQAVTELVAAMPAHRAKAEAITEVVLDMSPAYIAGVQTHFPKARIVFDLFHIMKLAGEALDAVRKSLRQQGADLTGGLWALRGNEWTRSQEQLDLRRKLARTYPNPGPPSPCARLSKEYWPMATCFPSAGGWAGPTVLGSNLSANSLELSKNISTASWPTWKPA